MDRRRAFLGAVCASALFAGCSSGSLNAESGAIAATAPGNIYWNKPALRLKADGGLGEATLSYWGPDGYYTEPIYCKKGGRIAAMPHGHSGKRSGYVHVIYWFRALTRSPDDCSLSAVLGNTGSPPIAAIKLRIL